MKRTQLSGEELKALRAIPVTAEMPNRLRVAMAVLDITQIDVASGTGLTQATISDIANGKYGDLKYSTVGRLATLFGCQMQDLFPPAGSAVDRDQPALPFAARRKAVNA